MLIGRKIMPKPEIIKREIRVINKLFNTGISYSPTPSIIKHEIINTIRERSWKIYHQYGFDCSGILLVCWVIGSWLCLSDSKIINIDDAGRAYILTDLDDSDSGVGYLGRDYA